jgi:hypothetical protein
MKRPPLAHKIIGAGAYVPADAHHTVDHLRRVIAAARKRVGSQTIIRVEAKK